MAAAGPNPVFGKPGVPETGVAVKRIELEDPPPGPGLVTLTADCPLAAISAGAITAVN